MLPSQTYHAPAWALATTALLAALLCIATLTPGGLDLNVGQPSNDKIQHLIGFGVLALPLGYAWPRHTWTVIAGVTLFGAMIELIQPFVGRDGGVADVAADALGATIGAFVMRFLRR